MSDQSPPLPALLPCPFCGNEAAQFDDSTFDDYIIRCLDERCLSVHCFAPTRAEAIARWNTRAPVGHLQLAAPGRFVIAIENYRTPGGLPTTITRGIGPDPADWSTPAARLFKRIFALLEADITPQTVIPNDRH